jgi:hypothetical protein
MISLALLSALALADAPPLLTYSGSENQLKVAVPRLDETIGVDGQLDDPAWSKAARLIDFSQYSPNDGRPAARKPPGGACARAWPSATS